MNSINYRDILQQYAVETACLEDAKMPKRQAFLDHALPIDAKLRELVSDKGLLRFLSARETECLFDSSRKTVRSISNLVYTPGGFTNVRLNSQGEIELWSTREGDAVYRLQENVKLAEAINQQHLQVFSEFIGDKDSAFICVRGHDYISQGDMLADQYANSYFKDQTPETLERTLAASLEEIARRHQ